jgi:hypothetical protein
METPVTNHDGLIIIKDFPAPKQDEAPKEIARVEEKERIEGDFKYRQPIWCPHGLNKTQRCKLQRAWHKQQKRKKLATMEGEIFNPIHIKILPNDQNTAAAAVPSAQPTLVLSQSTKPTPFVSTALEDP